jgi:hypothetical protein
MEEIDTKSTKEITQEMTLLDEGTGISAGPVSMTKKGAVGDIQEKESRNVKGLPEIARHRARLGNAFISRMRADFQKHGIAVIERVRKERPAAYLELIARLMPQQMEINVQHSFVDVLLEAQKRYNQEEPYVVIDAEVLREK